MGNCLQSTASEDVDLLEGDISDNQPQAGANISYENTTQDTSMQQNRQPQMSEAEQVNMAQRIGLIQHLPTDIFREESKFENKECVICMIEFEPGDGIRFLPCAHPFHTDCIDDWLMRSFTCPCCMEPVDAALLTTYEGYLPSAQSTQAVQLNSLRSTGSLSASSPRNV